MCAHVCLAMIAPILSDGTILFELFIMEDSCAACQTPIQQEKNPEVAEGDLFQELVPANVKPTKYLCRLCFRNLEKIVVNNGQN